MAKRYEYTCYDIYYLTLTDALFVIIKSISIINLLLLTLILDILHILFL